MAQDVLTLKQRKAERQHRYDTSVKGKARTRRYQATKKGHTALQRYDLTPQRREKKHWWKVNAATCLRIDANKI